MEDRNEARENIVESDPPGHGCTQTGQGETSQTEG
jgi:hypothetical protein